MLGLVFEQLRIPCIISHAPFQEPDAATKVVSLRSSSSINVDNMQTFQPGKRSEDRQYCF